MIENLTASLSVFFFLCFMIYFIKTEIGEWIFSQERQAERYKKLYDTYNKLYYEVCAKNNELWSLLDEATRPEEEHNEQ